ncbi:MAG: hypothetical protein PHX61_02350 [Alphaproteobacteria bacterium]|nr:hypothetical protein [Alphaproteobacteria bacterium]
MNLGGVFLLFFICIGTLLGLAYTGSHTASANAVTDTYGNTMSQETNNTSAMIGNVSATGQQVGGGAILVIGMIIVMIILGAFYLVVTRK